MPRADHVVTGTVALQRVGFRGFPVNQVVNQGLVIAESGHLGWLRVYLGRGVRVALADDTEWRVRAVTLGGLVRPVVVDASRRRVAIGSSGDGVYGINGRDYALTLNPGQPRRRAPWGVRQHETDIAAVHRRPLQMDCWEPVHLGAVLLSFVLVSFGVPDDYRAAIPRFRWD